uniref:Uncharacterized protein n=1 Tax=Ailuropoda melanoleuca TaxID=9646 RepID=A0A7N5KRL7_AILME
MLQYQMWQKINFLAKKLYLASPMKTLVIPKYRHSDGSLILYVTTWAIQKLRDHFLYFVFLCLL